MTLLTSGVPIAFLGLPGGVEWLVILVVALLIFGRRLPEVMRNMGRGITEFKKGVRGVEDDVKSSEIPPPAAESKETTLPDRDRFDSDEGASS